ncbi:MULTISPECIES: hypothetical protein [unclassified Achromobacter]|uniref:hypothetical protein n=1 Tax=unclassified Achromobacter TaxID=2626865 RepID=UPI0008AE48E8|nr:MULTISPECIES: hypothetical protein [unclassified Achromobacter]SEJ22963.1 hypothetical protein SAMN03159494_01895 [Achromobacter sp. NFACC18-2]SIT05667.1 hypothetical protein SAMN05428937_0479 [Achromobacter sp. MFA1 R4]
MTQSDTLGLLAVKGVQLKVFCQIFPVLRHEVLGPLSSASLAAAMLRQAPEGASNEAVQQRCERLAGDLAEMLEESVGVVRELEGWLSDAGATTPCGDLLQECRKLMFSHLLLSRHGIRWPEQVVHADVPVFSTRYLVLAWLLCLLPMVPADAHLELDASEPGVWRARLPEGGGAEQPMAFNPQEVELLATAAGWRLERQDRCWSLHLPAASSA